MLICQLNVPKKIKEYWFILDLKTGRRYKDKEGIVPHFEFPVQIQNYIWKRLKDVNYQRYVMRKESR